jgi:hypothetical protein
VSRYLTALQVTAASPTVIAYLIRPLKAINLRHGFVAPAWNFARLTGYVPAVSDYESEGSLPLVGLDHVDQTFYFPIDESRNPYCFARRSSAEP